jgi:toxin ParE1/3/4
MKPTVLWTPQAREDFLDIYRTIGLDNPGAAERFYFAMEARTKRLASQPRIGPRRPEIRPQARVLVERPYLILYETHPDTDDGPITEVEIVRILHGRRDLPSLL